MPEFISCARIESNHKKTYRDLLRVFMGQSVSTGITVTLANLAPPKSFDWLKLRATKPQGTSDF